MTFDDILRAMQEDARQIAARHAAEHAANERRFECIEGDFAHFTAHDRFKDAIDLGILKD